MLSKYEHPTTVVHGSGVVENLVAGIRHFRENAARHYWRRLGPTPAALGCVPWLTDPAVIDELSSFGGTCIVVDKQHLGPRAMGLYQRGRAISSLFLDGFEELSLPDAAGDGPVITPYSGGHGPSLVEPVWLGPVRVAGWAKHGREMLPLLHSKMLVLGVTTYYENDEDFSGDVARFNPLVTWMGSANWTENARLHIEHGVWSSDPALVSQNYEYLCGLISFSEDVSSAAPEPSPQLVPAVWDNEGFAEYLAERRFLVADDEEG